MASAKIPDHDYSVSMLEEPRLYSVVFTYEVKGEWYADTWNITERKNIGEALDAVNMFCEGNLDCGNWDAYEITNVNLIRKGV